MEHYTYRPQDREPNRRRSVRGSLFGVLGLGCLIVGAIVTGYNVCKIEVGTGEQAVLVRLAGLDLEPDMELAPPPVNGRYYKGVQAGGPDNGVLKEGRYFYNPFFWSWEIGKQFVVPDGKVGVRIALSGDDLPPDQVLAEPGQKGILRDVRKLCWPVPVQPLR